MSDSESVVEINFEQINGKDYAIFTIAGLLNLKTAAQIGKFVNTSIPIDYEGNVLLDIRGADDRLRNEDANEIATLIFKSRYFLRKPVAVLVPTQSPERSRQYFQNVAERGGILVRDFTSIDTATDWLSDPDQ